MQCDRASTTDSLQKAIRFLLNSRRRVAGGPNTPLHENDSPTYWSDFCVFGRFSDEWVTGYTAVALAGSIIPEARDAAYRAWRFLTADRPRKRPGLGYNRETPHDADSTQWGCRLAQLLGLTTDEWFQQGIELLVGSRTGRQPQSSVVPAAFLRPDGGIATYFVTAFPLMDGHRAREDAVRGWTRSHVCVTAATAWMRDVLAFGDLIGFLAREQAPQGYWNSYWWADREYATAHAVESLSRHGLQPEMVERGVRWLSECAGEISAFRLALRLIGISITGSDRAEGLLRRLLALQLGDGSWDASARLRIPPLDLSNPEIRWNWDEGSDGFGGIVIDRARVFTTATGVRALTSCLVR